MTALVEEAVDERGVDLIPSCQTYHPDMWFSDDEGVQQAARKVCAACPLLAECRRAAEKIDPPYGIWAGEDRYQRRNRMRKRKWPQAAPRPQKDQGHTQAQTSPANRTTGKPAAASETSGPTVSPESPHCPRGHRNWGTAADGEVRCETCYRSWMNRSQLTPRPRKEEGDPCAKGHTSTYRTGQQFRCRICRAKDKQAARERRRQQRKGKR